MVLKRRNKKQNRLQVCLDRIRLTLHVDGKGNGGGGRRGGRGEGKEGKGRKVEGRGEEAEKKIKRAGMREEGKEGRRKARSTVDW